MAAYVLDGLLRFLHRGEWAMEYDALQHRHMSSAARELELDVEDILRLLGYEHASQLSGWVFEDLLTLRLDGGRNLADDYLKRRGWKETARVRAYIAALRDSAVSLYEVSGLVPGESFLVRDLIRGGEPVRVEERSGSRYLRPWDRIATRIVPRRDTFEMSGGTLVFVREASEVLLATLRGGAPEGTVGQAWTPILADAASVFTKAWLLHFIPRVRGDVKPAILNSDGDELAPSTTLYPLRSDVPRESLVAALERMAALASDGPDVWSWRGEASPSPSAAGGEGVILSTFDEDGGAVLGTIKLTDDSLWLSTNSPARMTRLRALIEPAVAGLVGTPFSEVQPLDDVLGAPATGIDDDAPLDLPAADEREIMRDTMTRHYTESLDRPIPMLGNVSPRAAIGTEDGRLKVADWLKYLENASSTFESGAAVLDYDFTWMWERLGITHLRR